MKTLYHPNMRDTSIEVDADKVDAYVAQGWRKTDPSKKFEKAETVPDPTTDTTDSSASGEDNKKEG